MFVDLMCSTDKSDNILWCVDKNLENTYYKIINLHYFL